KSWVFPQLLRIAGEWYRQCVDCKDDAFPQLLYFAELAHNAADRIYRSISPQGESGRALLKPILAPYEWAMTTEHVGFDTTRSVYATRGKCHVSHVVCDTNSWEQKVAQDLEDLDEVVSYVKNDRQPGFSLPYTVDGDQRDYYPDFVARLNDGHGPDDLLNVIIEVTGEKKKEKGAKGARPAAAIRHQATRRHTPSRNIRDFAKADRVARKTSLWPRDPPLDPQLVWKGKDEQDRLDVEVAVVAIYIQEKIHAQAML